MSPRDEKPPPKQEVIITRPPALSRPLEPEELQDYREHWPDAKQLVIHYRFFGQFWWFLKRFTYFAGVVLGFIWAFRDIIGQVIKYLVGGH